MLLERGFGDCFGLSDKFESPFGSCGGVFMFDDLICGFIAIPRPERSLTNVSAFKIVMRPTILLSLSFTTKLFSGFRPSFLH